MQKIIKILSARLRSKSPELFNKISNWSIVIGLIAAIMLMFTWPAWVVTLLTIISSVCAGLAGSSSLTTDDEKLIQETKEVLKAKIKQ